MLKFPRKYMDLAINQQAKFDYEILEKYEAGLSLSGPEVKSVKDGQMSLKGAFVTFHGGDAYLFNAHISPYKQAGTKISYDPTQSRRLLLHQKEIRYLQGKLEEKGLTIVPLRVYTRNRFIKVEIALGKGKQQFDKRESIKKRDTAREMKRELKYQA
ncbi:MAG TPA: SsrA-binding protein SmpB [Patescibacteria group bacterium]|nr:SsrA-binding protein SmpB [Patescibacteria group bacterium]